MTTPSENELLHAKATAFVFGELSNDDAIAFMKDMDASPDLQATVASIRQTVKTLQSQFASEAAALGGAGLGAADQIRADQIRAMVASNGAESTVEPPPVERQANIENQGSTTQPRSLNDSQQSSRKPWIALALGACVLLVGALVWPALKNKTSVAQHDYASQIAAFQAENRKLVQQRKAIEASLATLQTSRPSVEGKDAGRPEPPEQTETQHHTTAPEQEVAPERMTKSLQAMSVPPELPESPPLASRTIDEKSMETEPDSHSVAAPMATKAASQEKEVKKAPRKRQGRGVMFDDMGMMGGDSMVDMEMGMGGSDEMSMEMDTMGMMSTDASAADPFGGGMGAGGGRAYAGGSVAIGTDNMQSNLFGDSVAFGLGIPPLQNEEQASGDLFAVINDNPFNHSSDSPLSTFSIDVDTASYSKLRMYLTQHNRLPQPDSVRIEEMLNYFDYDYTPPTDEHPFAAAMQIASCPWNAKNRLARIGIKGKSIEHDRPSSNLVFLLDVSGSMDSPNKLPLVIDGMKKLVNQLTENDSVAIVVYAGAAGLVLDSTTGDKKKTIIESLDRLKAGGSTAGAEGIQGAYSVARDHFIVGGTNRVILCSDGDFNVGVTGTDELVKIVADNAKGNIFLSVLGYGIGNHNDAMMEQISNKGNGNYAFIDTASESEKVLVDQMQGTLVTIAKDVKIQVEFNPAEVDSYRLIGYENRVMAAKDFANDKKDAGEIGAGHTVTALYELVPAQKDDDKTTGPALHDSVPLRYQSKARLNEEAKSGELLTLNLRYKQPTGDKSTLLTFPIKDSGQSFSQADQDFQFAASVAAFGMLLRNSKHKGDANYDSVEELATAGAQGDKTGYRAEFVDLVKRAKQLSGTK